MDSDHTVSNWQSLVQSGTFNARSSLLVVQGYVRMLLMERAGPVTETQRKCLEEAEKATTRVLGVVERLEILARWDQRPSQAKNAAVVALDALVRESTSALPIEMALDVRSDYGDEHVFGDGRHIRLLIDSVIRCVRSSIDGPVAVSVAASPVGETSERWVVVCAPDQLASASTATTSSPFLTVGCRSCTPWISLWAPDS